MERAGHGGSSIERFLAHIWEYGASSGDGYEHDAQTPESSFATPFLTNFFRAYDMSDSAIKVLRREDVTVRHHVDPNTVQFRVELPIIASSANPVVGANQVADRVLGLSASTTAP
jgi:hypothetical protein